MTSFKSCGSIYYSDFPNDVDKHHELFPGLIVAFSWEHGFSISAHPRIVKTQWAQAQVSNSEMSNFPQGQGKQKGYAETYRGTSHKQPRSLVSLRLIDTEIAEKGHLWMETSSSRARLILSPI